MKVYVVFVKHTHHDYPIMIKIFYKETSAKEFVFIKNEEYNGKFFYEEEEVELA